MKSICVVPALGLCLSALAHATTVEVDAVDATSQPEAVEVGWRGMPRSAHETDWKRSMVRTNAATGKLQTNVVSYTEIGNWLNVQDPVTGTWQKSQPEFVVTADGLESRGSGCKVVLIRDIAQVSAITVSSSDGVALHSTPLGLSLNDGQNAVVVAAIKSSTAVLVSSNIVLYPDCFSGAAKADVRVVLSRAGVEVDVILREQIAVAPMDLNMDAQRVKMEVITEAFESPMPAPTVSATPTLSQTNRLFAQAQLADSTYRFGTLIMAQGRAFLTANELAAPDSGSDALAGAVPVGKTIEQFAPEQGGESPRDFLIESSRWQDIAPKLQQLPPTSILTPVLPGTNDSASATSLRSLGPEKTEYASVGGTSRRLLRSLRAASPSTGEVQIAQSSISKTSGAAGPSLKPQMGLVLDYTLVGSTAGYYFQSQQTYFVNQIADLRGGPVTFGANCVIKYGPGASLLIDGAITCLGEPGQMGILTSQSDNAVGEVVYGSNGDPWGDRLANPALGIFNTSSDLKYLKISFAAEAIAYYGPDFQRHKVSHSQFVQCSVPFTVYSSDVTLRNVLVVDSQKVFQGQSYNVRAEHLTAHKAFVDLATNYNGIGSVTAVNSLLVGITNCSMPYDFSDCTTWHQADLAGVFANAGWAGNHYLAMNSTNRNSAGPNINAALKEVIQTMTTYPPRMTNGTLNGYVVLGPQAAPDNDGLLDRGYHYPILDWLITTNGIALPGSILMISNATVAVDFGTTGNGFVLDWGGTVMSEGTPLRRNAICCALAVQEGPVLNLRGSADPPSAVFKWADDSSQPTLNLHYTDLPPLLPGPYTLFDTDFARAALSFNSCEICGASISSSYSASLSCFNCVLRNCSFSLYAGATDYGPCTAVFANNTTIGGGVSFYDGYYPIWHDGQDGGDGWYEYGNCFSLNNNIFHGSGLSDGGGNPSVNGYNGWIGYYGVGQLNNSFGGDVFLDALSYDSAPLSKYYLPRQINGVANPLVDAGSASATAFGFFHETTAASQVKETNSTCDLGAHFMALIPPTTNDVVWLDDELPSGAIAVAENDSWAWVESPAPFSGSSAHQSASQAAFHQHYFTNATAPLLVQDGDKLYCYVYLDGGNLPREMMLQWFCADESGWHHRAYWGANEITSLGPRVSMGALPAPNAWVRLEVPSIAVDLEGRSISGMSFALSNGRATWDYAGVLSITQPLSASDLDEDGIPDFVEDANQSGTTDNGETNFLAYDSDGDGLSDYEEIYVLHTNPNKSDTEPVMNSGALVFKWFSPVSF